MVVDQHIFIFKPTDKNFEKNGFSKKSHKLVMTLLHGASKFVQKEIMI